MTDNGKVEFPIEKPDGKCPTCGSEEKIIQPYFDTLEEEGKAPRGSLQNGALLQILIPQALNRLAPIPEIPMLIIGYEVCGECFTIYATRIFTGVQRLQPQPGQAGKLPPMPPIVRG